MLIKEWICTVCGYVSPGDEAPEKCPQCGAPQSKFRVLDHKAIYEFMKANYLDPKGPDYNPTLTQS